MANRLKVAGEKAGVEMREIVTAFFQVSYPEVLTLLKSRLLNIVFRRMKEDNLYSVSNHLRVPNRVKVADEKIRVSMRIKVTSFFRINHSFWVANRVKVADGIFREAIRINVTASFLSG